MKAIFLISAEITLFTLEIKMIFKVKLKDPFNLFLYILEDSNAYIISFKINITTTSFFYLFLLL